MYLSNRLIQTASQPMLGWREDRNGQRRHERTEVNGPTLPCILEEGQGVSQRMNASTCLVQFPTSLYMGPFAEYK